MADGSSARGAGGVSRAVYDALIDPHATLAAVRDDAGVIVEFVFEDVNRAAVDFHRRTRSEVVGATLREITGEEIGGDDTRETAHVLESGSATIWNDVWSRVREEQGEAPTWLDIRIVPVDGERVSYSWRDVTDRHLAQERLAQSERRFRLLAETSSDVVYFAGTDRRITWIAPTVTRSLGWTPEELIGTEAIALAHPDERMGLIPNREAAYAGAPLPEPDLTRGHLARIRARDGSYRWMKVSNEVLRDTGGALLGVAGSMRDVHDLIVAREELASSHDLLRAVIDAQVDPHVLFRAVRDDDGVIVDFLYEDANQAAADFEGRTRAELIGSTMLQIAPSYEEGEVDLADTVRVMESDAPGVWNDEPTVDYVDSQGRRVIVDIRIVRIDDERASYSWRDVTDRHDARTLVARSEERFRLLAETTSDVVSLVRHGRLAWVSPSVTRAFGWTPEELVGADPFELVHPEDVEALTGAWLPAEGPVLGRRRYRLRRKDGEYHWVDSEGRLISESAGASAELMLSTRIVDAEVAALAALEIRARHDALTGLVNRVEMFDQVNRMLSGFVRTGNRLAMVFCDLDGFKAVNDSHGHNAGDVLLRTIAERLQGAVRAGDIVGRLGGDELLVVLNGVRDLDDAIRIADKLGVQIAEPVDVPGGRVSVSASIGVTLAEDGEDVDSIVARADAAMYEAKRRGKNAVFAVKGPEA